MKPVDENPDTQSIEEGSRILTARVTRSHVLNSTEVTAILREEAKEKFL